LQGATRPILVDGAVFVVPSKSQNPDKAIELLTELYSPESLHDAAMILEQFPASPAATEFDGLKGKANTSLYTEILTTSKGVSAITTPFSPDFESTLLQIGELVLYQGAEPVKLLEQAQMEFAPRLEQIRP
jgi:hypothetical protein